MNFLATSACGLACATAMVLLANGATDDLAMPRAARTEGGYVAATLVPDIAEPWAVAVAPRAYAWVANEGPWTRYDGDGRALPPAIAGTARMTAVVQNDSQAFRVRRAGRSQPCAFIAVVDGATLSCRTPEAAVRVFDGTSSGARYTGLAIAGEAASSVLVAADFDRRTVDVFDAAFTKVALRGRFADPELPADYAPFGVHAIGDLICIAYAKRDAAGRPATGAGLGLVDVFDIDGRFVRRLVSPGGKLDAPWGMALAPADFGPLGNALLVANAGDGRIHAYDPATGMHLGTLSAPDGEPIVIDGLRGIAFGRGLYERLDDAASLYYTAGPHGGSRGRYGRIDIA